MIKYVVLFFATFLIVVISLSFKSYIQKEIHNLSFKHKYNNARGNKKPMARLTEQAYIKGLNQGYALARAQYDSRSAILYCSPSEYICQRCGHRIGKDKITVLNYCNKCGSKFYTRQPISYDPNNDNQ